MESAKFKVEFLDEAIVYLERLETKVRNKIIYNITKAQFSNDKELFKKLQDEIWEFRTQFNKSQYRLFAFWDKSDHANSVVIATHGIIKKTQKTPYKEIQKAEQIRMNYFNLK